MSKPKNLPTALARLDVSLDNIRAEKARAQGLIREGQEILTELDARLNEALRAAMDISEIATS